MRCPVCGQPSRVQSTHHLGSGSAAQVMRYRHCPACGWRGITYESHDATPRKPARRRRRTA